MEAIESSKVSSRVSVVDGSRVEGIPVVGLWDVGFDVGLKARRTRVGLDVGRRVVGTSCCGHVKFIRVEFKRRYAFAIR